MRDRLAISFVIPAYNERRHLPRTLDAIRRNVPPDVAHEVIVVDHGSGDGSPEVAEQRGARVLRHHGGTIGGLRNKGVDLARGAVIVFLDADVRLTAEWGAHIGRVLGHMAEHPGLVTGSYSDLPENAGWLQRNWFGPRVTEVRGDYLPTQHLIVSRAGFRRVGGFDESLETGEDYEFCRRASAQGFAVVANPDLRVIHDGFPDDVRSFLRREVWHGRGDFASLANTLRSRVALAALLFLALHLTAGVAVVAGRTEGALLALVLIGGLTAGGSIQRFRRAGPGTIVANAPLVYLYLAGRALSFLQLLWRPQVVKRTREGGA